MRTWGLGPSLSTAEAKSSPEQGEQDWGHRDSSFWVIGELQLLAEDHYRTRGLGWAFSCSKKAASLTSHLVMYKFEISTASSEHFSSYKLKISWSKYMNLWKEWDECYSLELCSAQPPLPDMATWSHSYCCCCSKDLVSLVGTYGTEPMYQEELDTNPII